jgi:hypothetical protein
MSGKDFFEPTGPNDPNQYYRPAQQTTDEFFAPPPGSPQPTAPSRDDLFRDHAAAFGGPAPSYGTSAAGAYGSGGAAMSGNIEPIQQQPGEASFDSPSAGLVSGGSGGSGGDGRPSSPAPAPAPQAPGNYSWYQIEYYRYLFNVDTKEVLQRLFKSLIPWPPNFIEIVRSNPDLYGPFWITTTVVFLMAAMGNFGSYLDAVVHDCTNDWDYKFSVVSVGALAVYGYNIIVPLILWIMSRCLEINITLLDALCIYGYALFIYIPAAILSPIPSSIARWILVAIACGISTTFLVGNFFRELKANVKYGLFIVLGIAALHLGLALVVRLYFFQVADDLDCTNTNSTITAALKWNLDPALQQMPL